MKGDLVTTVSLADAPVVASEGRAFPVETRYLGRKVDAPLERQMADAIATAATASEPPL